MRQQKTPRRIPLCMLASTKIESPPIPKNASPKNGISGETFVNGRSIWVCGTKVLINKKSPTSASDAIIK